MVQELSWPEAQTNIRNYDLIVVGSGMFGLTVAERASNLLGKRVLIIERRGHLGGNAFTEIDKESNIEVHKYGPHIFHTSNERVWEYVRRFTDFNSYRHHVWSRVGDDIYPLPISLATLSKIEGRVLDPTQAREWLRRETLEINSPSNFEEKALASLGPRLYEMFFRGYTAKQWETDPRDIPAEVFGRLPIRFDFSTRYFSDSFEGIPTDGYSEWLARMGDSERIDFAFHTDFADVRGDLPALIPLVYTGPLDEFFKFEFGRLSWRTLDFEFQTLAVKDFQGTSQINFPEQTVPFTRTVEYRHFHPEWKNMSQNSTVISREYSRKAAEGDEPFYPVNSPQDRSRLLNYRQAADQESNVFFGGRLGTYQYLDMHMAIASALSLFDTKLQRVLSD
ncbi:UDP-galactopyranose mutase [Pontimonas sp.]|nr:UDP-galactopyranose mutase [Pontimonas sp.]